MWLAVASKARARSEHRVIGVTGTKGKITTAALATHLAEARGLAVHLAGNIGAPALDLLDSDATELAVVDELASAAELVMGKLDRVPVALVRGASVAGDGRVQTLLRDPATDLFR